MIDILAAIAIPRRVLRRFGVLLGAYTLLALTPHVARAQYERDPGFNGGQYYVDAFFDNQSRSYTGQKIVRLENGDVIVAGIVPPIGTGNNAVNLGLVRYNAAGVRVAWANPGTYGYNGNQSVVYPNTNDITVNNTSSFIEVTDMKVFGARLFVLADASVPTGISPARRGARVTVFTLDGAFVASTPVGPFGLRTGGFALYSTVVNNGDTLVLAGNTDPALGPTRAYFGRYSVAANGTLSLSFEATPNPGNLCPDSRNCVINGLGLARNSLSGVTGVYLAGGRQSSGNDWDFLVMALGLNGEPVNAFSGDGGLTVPFDRGGSLSDIANDIVVSRVSSFGANEIYVVGNVAQSCKQGVGVVKLAEAGAVDEDFGAAKVIGGSNAPLCLLASAETHGLAAAVSGDRIAVAGYVQTPSPVLCGGATPCPEHDVDAAAIVLDAVTGSTLFSGTFPFSETVGGARSRHASFSDVAAGDGDFTLTGSARFLQSAAGAPAGRLQFATLRIEPGAGLFSHGFESD